MRRWGPRLAALGAGALPVLAFPRAGIDVLAWVALVPGLLLVRAADGWREAAIRGWWLGTGFLIAAHYWLLPNIGPGLPLIAAGVGGMWALFGLAGWATLRTDLTLWRLVLAGAVIGSVWVLIEAARSWHMLGGPWALLGTSQWRHPSVIALAGLGGVWLVSFVIVLVNVAVAAVLLSGRMRVRCAAAVVAGAGVATGPVAYAIGDEPTPTGRFTVAMVQPGVVRGSLDRLAAQERITREITGVDLITWGESSVGFDPDRRADVRARLTALSGQAGVPLLVNVDARGPAGGISKTAVLFGPEGIRDRYVKTRLVPFGEYIPFRRQLGWLTRVSRAAKEDRVPGAHVRALTGARYPLGTLICFESTFPDLARVAVRRGARVLVYQSATSSFQESWAPAQHASVAALRAAETGRPVVHATLTGVSAAYDARGRRLAWLETNRTGQVVVQLAVPAQRATTPYHRHGDYVLVAALGVAAMAGIAWLAAAGWRRNAGRDASSAVTDAAQ